MKKRVSDSKTEQAHLLMPQHLNPYGRLFGGVLMQWIDVLAGIVGRRHCGIVVTTASIDNLTFIHPAYINQMVVLEGCVTYVGKTSMEIRVDTYVEEMDGNRDLINRAYVVMVAIDKEGNSVVVPGLELETECERAEWENGKKRYDLRKLRRREGY